MLPRRVIHTPPARLRRGCRVHAAGGRVAKLVRPGPGSSARRRAAGRLGSHGSHRAPRPLLPVTPPPVTKYLISNYPIMESLGWRKADRHDGGEAGVAGS